MKRILALTAAALLLATAAPASANEPATITQSTKGVCSDGRVFWGGRCVFVVRGTDNGHLVETGCKGWCKL